MISDYGIVMTIAYLGDDIYRVGTQNWGEDGLCKFKYESASRNNLEELVRGVRKTVLTQGIM